MKLALTVTGDMCSPGMWCGVIRKKSSMPYIALVFFAVYKRPEVAFLIKKARANVSCLPWLTTP